LDESVSVVDCMGHVPEMAQEDEGSIPWEAAEDDEEAEEEKGDEEGTLARGAAPEGMAAAPEAEPLGGDGGAGETEGPAHGCRPGEGGGGPRGRTPKDRVGRGARRRGGGPPVHLFGRMARRGGLRAPERGGGGGGSGGGGGGEGRPGGPPPAPRLPPPGRGPRGRPCVPQGGGSREQGAGRPW